jgi:excisionase family DNA binding protein
MNMTQWSDLPLVLTSDQAAAVLQLKRRTIANMLDRGDLRGVKIGKEWRVGRAELMRFVEGNGGSKAKVETARQVEIEAEAAPTTDAWEHDSILSIISLGAGGPPDLSSRHHEYLAQAPEEEWHHASS